MTGGERKRSEIVVTLLAVLELCRQGKIRTQQTELFGDIVIERQTTVPNRRSRLGAESHRRGRGPALRLRRAARGRAHPRGARSRERRGRARARRGADAPATRPSRAACRSSRSGGGYRMVTRPELAPWLVRLARARTRVRLSRPALETLAIVAYKQPVSRPELDAVRGVNSDARARQPARAPARPHRPAARRRRAARSSTRRRASSWSPSGCATSAICPRSTASWSSRTSAPPRRPSAARAMAKLRLNKILAQAGLTLPTGG